MLVRVWVQAAACAALVPLLLVTVGPHLPVVGRHFDPDALAWWFISPSPDQNVGLWYLVPTALVYSVVGLWLQARSAAFAGSRGWRTTLADEAFAYGLALLLLTVPLLSVIWTLALAAGLVPSWPWFVNEGNHGPWRYWTDLRNLLGPSLFVPIVGVGGACVSFLIRFTSRAAWLVLAGLVTFVVLLMHSMLTD